MANFGDHSNLDDYSIKPEDRMDYMSSSQYDNTPPFSTLPSATQPLSTQPSPLRPSTTRKRRNPTIQPSRKVWTEVEDVRLCKAWVHVSTDKVVRNDQTSGGFWVRVAEEYYTDLPAGWVDNRSSENIRHHFGDLSARIKQFQYLLKYEMRKNQSGGNEADMIKAAEEKWAENNNNKSFKDHRSFEILKDQPKWHAKVGKQTTKKQKSNQGGSRSTDFEFDVDEEIEEIIVSDELKRRTCRKDVKVVEATGSQTASSNTSQMMGLIDIYKTEQDTSKEVSLSQLSIIAESYKETARAQRLFAETRIMEMDPNDPSLTDDRRTWILKKQRQIASQD